MPKTDAELTALIEDAVQKYRRAPMYGYELHKMANALTEARDTIRRVTELEQDWRWNHGKEHCYFSHTYYAHLLAEALNPAPASEPAAKCDEWIESLRGNCSAHQGHLGDHVIAEPATQPQAEASAFVRARIFNPLFEIITRLQEKCPNAEMVRPMDDFVDAILAAAQTGDRR